MSIGVSTQQRPDLNKREDPCAKCRSEPSENLLILVLSTCLEIDSREFQPPDTAS